MKRYRQLSHIAKLFGKDGSALGSRLELWIEDLPRYRHQRGAQCDQQIKLAAVAVG
jgi:hypothetical protein